MKWLPALLLGAIMAFTLPLAFGGIGGFWMNTWTKWGTVRPIEGSPGLRARALLRWDPAAPPQCRGNTPRCPHPPGELALVALYPFAAVESRSAQLPQ